MDSEEIIEKIINLSMKLKLMFFDRNYKTSQWKLKQQSEIDIIINEHKQLLHDNFYIRLKILHSEKKYNYANNILKTLQIDLQILDKLESLVKQFFQNSYVRMLDENIIIEEFSTNYK